MSEENVEIVRRASIAGLIVLMALGSLALWTLVPVAWLWLTRDMSDGARFVLSLPGCAITMFAFGALLFWVEAVYARMTGRDREPAPSGWRRSSGDSQTRRPMSLLETFLVVSAVVALLGLVAWWTFFADASDPSGPIQPL